MNHRRDAGWLICLLGLACQGKILGDVSALQPGAGAAQPGESGTGGGSTGVPGADAGGAAGTTVAPPMTPDGRYICDQGPYPVHADARRLTALEYQNAIRDIFEGKVAASAQYPGPYGKSVTGYSTEPDLNIVGQQGAESLMIAAENVAEALAPQLPALLPCAGSATDPGETCVSTFIDKYVRRAYHRSPTTDERAQLLTTYRDGRTSGANFTAGVAMLTVHALQTAQFLYVTEAAAPAPGRALDSHELATRLSFLFWGSVPDDALLALADSDALKDSATLESEARRLLADPRADSAMQRFFREWTQTAPVTPDDKDPAAFPDFTTTVASSMIASFDRYAADQMRGGTLSTLLTSSEAWVDSTLAGFFGVPAPASGWAKVALDPTIYSGLATQPAFLASAAHFNTTSYVFRGRFLRRRLLCTDLAAPPANAQAQFDMLPKPPDPTGKDLSLAVTSIALCGTCHKLMDPAGLALENFDAIGQYRTSYPSGKAIDPSGHLDSVGDHGLDFNSQLDLFTQLATEPVVASCLSKQLLRFTLSRASSPEDACAIQAIGDVVAAGGQIADALISLTHTDAFTQRRDP